MFKAQATRHSEPASQTSQANNQVPILTNSGAGFHHQPPQSTSDQSRRADSAVDQAPAQGPSFPLILPSRRQLSGVSRLRDRDSLTEDVDSFSIDLVNEAVLREKQTRSEVLDRVAHFCGLVRANAQTTQEVMGMINPFYSEQKKRAIELSLPWHNSTMQIAQRDFDIVNGRLSKNMKSLNPAKPWGPRDYFTGSATIFIMVRDMSLSTTWGRAP